MAGTRGGASPGPRAASKPRTSSNWPQFPDHSNSQIGLRLRGEDSVISRATRFGRNPVMGRKRGRRLHKLKDTGEGGFIPAVGAG